MTKRPLPHLLATLALGCLLSVSAVFAHAEATGASAVPLRWQSSMAAFAASDRDHLPGSDGVVFVGSSTIRLWTSLAQDFRQLPVVINRGFGGSTMADCQLLARELVNRYKPRHVLIYAGDNDLAEGRTPTQVLESFASFVRIVRSELPATRISYISIKPSPLRSALLPQIRETNLLLSAYLKTLNNAEYIDIYTAMLGPEGQPRPELFRADHLHMNEAGYALWQNIITARLSLPVPAAFAAPPAPRPHLSASRPAN